MFSFYGVLEWIVLEFNGNHCECCFRRGKGSWNMSRGRSLPVLIVKEPHGNNMLQCRSQFKHVRCVYCFFGSIISIQYNLTLCNVHWMCLLKQASLLLILAYFTSLCKLFSICIYAFGRCFYPKQVMLHLSYAFFLPIHAFHRNQTHDLDIDNVMLFRKALFVIPQIMWLDEERCAFMFLMDQT